MNKGEQKRGVVMVMSDNCIRLKRKDENAWDETPWEMIIDLKQVVKISGVRTKDLYNGGSYVDYPIAKARKLIRFILDNGDPEDFARCEICFRKNKKLYKWWQKYSEDYGYDFSKIQEETELPFC